MSAPRYTRDYDSHLGLYRWQVAPGERLEAPARQALRPASRVVALGGGTGLPIVLEGLKAALFPQRQFWTPEGERDRLTAIVTVADDGGSSGRLRQAYGVPPPGDVRNCLLALAEDHATMASIFNFRFNGEGEVAGHSLGNLILAALSQMEKDFSEAVERGSQILAVRGRVFPSTCDAVILKAEFDDGSRIEGESRIAAARRRIRRVSLEPEDARALPQALEALTAADLIVIGPGSLYTSLIPILLVKEIADAIAGSRARVLLAMNLMTEPGETEGYTTADHLSAIQRHAPQVPIHDVLLNATPLPANLIEQYGAEGAAPVPGDLDQVRALGCQPVERDLLSAGPKIRHDPHKLARAILEIL